MSRVQAKGRSLENGCIFDVDSEEERAYSVQVRRIVFFVMCWQPLLGLVLERYKFALLVEATQHGCLRLVCMQATCGHSARKSSSGLT